MPLSGRRLVQALWRHGVAASSGSACSASHGAAASPVLTAMGYGPDLAAAGLRLSLGGWCQPAQLALVPEALRQAMDSLEP